MKHLDLLGTELKSDFLCDLFETYDVQVIYEYDRTYEGLEDEYRAELPELGLQFVFDENQFLTTVFLRPVTATTFNPFDAKDERLREFSAKSEALLYARTSGLRFTEGAADFMDEHKEWIRFESDTYSIHYEFVGTQLRMITLQSEL